MTVEASDTIERDVIAGVGPYPFSFRIFAGTDLAVSACSDAVPSVPTLLTYLTHYTVAGVNSASGGTVTLTSDAAATYDGYILDIRSNTPLTQPTSIRNAGRFLPEIHEDAYDRMERQLQDLRRIVRSCLRYPDNGLADGELSPLSAWVSRYVTVSASGEIEPAALTETVLTASLMVSLLGGSVSQANALSVLLAQRNALTQRTAAEISAGVEPIAYAYPPGELTRQTSNDSPGVTNVAIGFQAAVDATDDVHAEIYLRDDLALGKPILLRSSTQQNISLIGNGRVSTIVRPLASDIKQSPQNVNALFINQNNNGHLHISKLRCLDSSAYIGIFLYCKESGGGDSSCQALFSAVVDDCWFSFSSNNAGIFQGGFSNLRVSGCVFEATKTGCFILEGLGNGDQQYIGNVMNHCYDSFLYGVADTQVKASILVDGLTVYQHLRGRIVTLKNGKLVTITNVFLEADASNVGDIGLCRFEDCADINVSHCTMTTANGTPRGDVGLEFVGSNTGRITASTICADVGVRFSGVGSLDLTFENVDFGNCQYAVQFLSGTLSGRLRFLGCKFNNTEYGFLQSAGTMSFDLDVIDCEIINAGYPTVVTGRNVNLSMSGNVRLINTKVGQNNADADAAYYFLASGSGSFKVIGCPIQGTPPTGLVDAASTQGVKIVRETGYGGVIASSANITLPDDGDIFQISGTTTITGISGGTQEGRRVTLIFQGALTFTDGSNLRLNSNFVTTTDDTVTLVCINSVWFETSRSTN